MATSSILAAGTTAARSTNVTVASGGSASLFLFAGAAVAPVAPTLGQVAGGAIAATTYYVKATYTTLQGETVAGAEASLAVGANALLTVTIPASTDPRVTGAKVYVSTATGTETLQASVTPGVAWTLPTTGLVAGAALPGADTTAGGDLPATSQVGAVDLQNPDGTWTPTGAVLDSHTPRLLLNTPGTYSVRRRVVSVPPGVASAV